MLRKHVLTLSCGFLALSLVALGCGGDSGYKGPAGTVSGTVTFQGKPVDEGSVVTFMPLGSSHVASGTVGADGKYSMLFNTKQNIPTGKYGIQISDPPPAAGAIADPANLGASSKASAPRLPTKFYSTSSSGLTYTVKEGSNPFDITLE